MNPKSLSRLGKMTLILPLLWAGCSSTPKALLPTNANPNEEVTRLRHDLAQGEANDFAVLDRDDFEKSRTHLLKAEGRMRDNESQSAVLQEIAVARAYYERADTKAASRRSLVESVLDTRTNAIQAGATKYPQTRQELARADLELRDVAEGNRAPGAEKVSNLQKRYSDVQMSALEIEHLGPAASMIEAAKNQGASSKASDTYNQAKTDYVTARNAISMNRQNPAAFSAEVKQANLSADTLSKVMQIAARDGSKFNERDAIRIVWQDRRLTSLGSELAQNQSERDRLQYEMKSQSETLAARDQDLAASRQKIALQQALVEAQERFDPKEAEVYQQGNNLLIRLKSIEFPTGKASIPSKADELLTKVQAVVSDLNPSKVVVQGHTDSTGSPKVNEKLSEKRAEEVADYLKQNGVEARIVAEGMGASKPLANNKTKAGRAQNRRIDIVVTPAEANL
jgi:OOP family OmpA-OmpF porin